MSACLPTWQLPCVGGRCTRFERPSCILRTHKQVFARNITTCKQHVLCEAISKQRACPGDFRGACPPEAQKWTGCWHSTVCRAAQGLTTQLSARQEDSGASCQTWCLPSPNPVTALSEAAAYPGSSLLRPQEQWTRCALQFADCSGSGERSWGRPGRCEWLAGSCPAGSSNCVMSSALC